MIKIPDFKEVYRLKIRKEDNLHVTICELRDSKTNEVLAFGIARIKITRKYNPNYEKALSFAKAIRFLMNNLRGNVETIDKTPEPEYYDRKTKNQVENSNLRVSISGEESARDIQ